MIGMSKAATVMGARVTGGVVVGGVGLAVTHCKAWGAVVLMTATAVMAITAVTGLCCGGATPL